MEKTIETLAEAICGAREFCGNEREALADAAADLGIKLTPEMRSAAFWRAGEIWAGYQTAAGVSRPIDSHERATIERIFRKAP